MPSWVYKSSPLGEMEGAGFMQYTPERIAKLRQKEAQTPDALKRDPNVNYYEGWFFVTLNTRDEAPVLSMCMGSPSIPDGQPGAPRCEYSELGLGVLEAWKRNEEVYRNVVVDMAEAMPEHFHGLIHLLPGNKKHLGHIIGGFMSGCSHAYWDTLGIDWHKDRYFEDARASAWQDKDRDHTRSYRGPALFVHGYNDMEPITEEEVEVRRAYIRDQARKRLIQGDRHECFRKYRHKRSANWTLERVVNAVVGDRSFRYCDNARLEAVKRNILLRLNTGASPSPQCTGASPSPQCTGVSPSPHSTGASPSQQDTGISPSQQDTGASPSITSKPLYLDHIGNRALLTAPRRLPLICHRADAWQFEVQKAAVIKAAREGAVIVSAFISPKEREIRNQLMVELLPFVEIMDNGINDKYKGIGKAFYALAENRLFQISPWTYQYEKEQNISREMCLVMNELARIISGESDDWWKKS